MTVRCLNDDVPLYAKPPAPPVDALGKAAGEWKDARDALNAFEAENPGNTTKRWANLLRDAERTEEAFWSALAAYRGEKP